MYEAFELWVRVSMALSADDRARQRVGLSSPQRGTWMMDTAMTGNCYPELHKGSEFPWNLS
ncbi:unnamed protein product [Fusarium graminearum]|uniref:Chromosome 4, complete genome n=2 Tax=Gibberella zeae TaxID=5518 RepID=A0A098DSF0_GIBZE|nr:unnamed protein product [Fusarium graminearum]CAF3616482.1 unnamed protein product [Fusarium graminearum]CAG1980794.1 unnamed protein product [Fusarium graminearum]CAG2012822.1 unnamed protein product [Fusarium graminearum]CEF84810.1 unnamed protein product [Fusarium graminearum]